MYFITADMLKRILISLAMVCTPFWVAGQELLCNVEVNSQQVEGTNKSVFNALREGISSYMNETKFSNLSVAPNERIECRFFLTVKEYKDDKIKGELQLQLSRPVYNSTYTTTLFNFRDTKVEFNYKEGDPIVFSEAGVDNNLNALLDFYAYLFLGIDFDSFSPRGGTPFFERAQTVVQQAQGLGETGWKTFEDTKNRAAVLGSYTDSNAAPMRDLLYQYHRKGLDEMANSPDKGRNEITGALENLKNIAQSAPMSVGLSIFRDSKLDELVNIYSKSNADERGKAFEILQPVYPSDNDRLIKIKNGGEKR